MDSTGYILVAVVALAAFLPYLQELTVGWVMFPCVRVKRCRQISYADLEEYWVDVELLEGVCSASYKVPYAKWAQINEGDYVSVIRRREKEHIGQKIRRLHA